MEKLQNLIDIIEQLLGPEGCPWDREQTMKSMRADLLEETHEFLHAIDVEDYENAKEELGDLLFLVLFIAKLAEKENRFDLNHATDGIANKLVRRHPHVFAGTKGINESSEVLKQWDELKLQERKSEPMQCDLDNIQKGMPTLVRAQKVMKRFHKAGFEVSKQTEVLDEKSFGDALLSLISQGYAKGLDAENALRSSLAAQEAIYRNQFGKAHE